MVSTAVIREVTIRGRSEGLDQLAVDLEKVAAGQVKVSQTAGGMATATETSSRRQISAANALRALESRIDGVTRANRAAEAQERTLQRAVDQGIVSQERAGDLSRRIEANRISAVAQAQTRQSMNTAVSAANENDRANRFGLRGYQTSNLAYQGGDVVAQLSSGAGIGQIVMMQGPQVAQILAEAEGGVKGVAAGLASLATPTTLAIAGFTALAGGALYFATRADSSVKSAAEALENYKTLLENLGPGFERAGSAAEAAFKQARPEGANVAAAMIGESRDVQMATLGAEMDKLIPKTQGFVTEWKNVTPEVIAAQAKIRILGTDLETHKITVAQFRDSVAQIRLPDGTPPAVRKIVDGILEASKNARDLTNALRATDAAAGAAAEQMSRVLRPGNVVTLGDRFGQNPLDYRMDPDLMGDMRSKLFQQRSSLRGPDTDLDVREIEARTVAERALIAAERERRSLQDTVLDQNPTQDSAMKVAREEAAATKVRLEAARAAQDTLRDARTSFDQAGLTGYAASLAEISARYGKMIDEAKGATDAVNALRQAQQAEVDTLNVRTARQMFEPLANRSASLSGELEGLGKSEAERRRLMVAMQAEQDLQRAGIEANSAFGQSYLKAAGNVGALEDALGKAKLAQDASFRRASAFMTDQEASIAQTLRSNGIDADSAFGQQFAAYERLTDRLEEFKQANREVWSSIGSDILDGAKPLDAISDALKDPAGKMLDKAIQNGADGLFNIVAGGLGVPLAAPTIPKEMLGTSAATAMWVQMAGGLPGVPNSLAPANSNVSTSSDAVTRAALPPLDPASARVAGAFDLTSVTDPAVLATLRRNPDRAPVAQYLADGALSRGMDPETVLRGLNQESGFNINARNLSSREQSYGIAQLNTMGGLGETALRRGIDVRDPSTWRQQADFSLDTMRRDGYRQWYGFRDVGIGRWDGMDRNGGSAGSAEAVSKLGETSTALAENASTFQANFAGTLNDQLLGSMGSTVDQFAPGFGGALQSIIKAMQQGGGVGGGLGGLFSVLFGGGISAGTTSAINAGAVGLFADGGFTGHGGVNQPAGVVHRGEIVWSQRDIAKAGGVGAVEAMRLGMRGYADGGVVGGEPRMPANANPLPAANGNGPRVVINDMRTTRGAEPVETRQSQDEFGRPQIEVMVRDIADDQVTRESTKTNRKLRGTYGLERQVMRR